MECIFCGGEFYSSHEADKVCTPCERAIERLHIGMTPDRLFELSKAEKDGRLVVLPCKAGDTVYVVGTRRVIECIVCEEYFDDEKEIECLVSFECDGDCDDCPLGSWEKDYSGEYSCRWEGGEAVISGIDFGKTVFLTRQEAEAAAREEDNNDA